MRFGVHTGLQNTTFGQLQQLWRRIESHPFDWISIWDHFYSADASPRDGGRTSGTHSFEALTAHTALALTTDRVTCGSLVYCAGYRHPAVLANAMATLDHVAKGRVVLGLGAGWHQHEFEVYGIPFPSPRERLRILEETLQCVRLLLTEEVAEFSGEQFHLRDAHCDPKPVQARLPIWVGGGGERHTLRITAQHADGWNLAFVPPDTFRHKSTVLDSHCDAIGRDAAEITRTVNLALAADDDVLARQFGTAAGFVAPTALPRGSQATIDRIGEYRAAGAEWVIVAMRAPFDVEALDRFAEEVIPAFAD